MSAPVVRNPAEQPLDFGKYQPGIDRVQAEVARDDEAAAALVPTDEQFVRGAVAAELRALKWVQDRFAQDFYDLYLSTGDGNWKTAWFAARDHSESLETRATGIESGRIDIQRP